jgi:hypothetical protein
VDEEYLSATPYEMKREVLGDNNAVALGGLKVERGGGSID